MKYFRKEIHKDHFPILFFYSFKSWIVMFTFFSTILLWITLIVFGRILKFSSEIHIQFSAMCIRERQRDQSSFWSMPLFSCNLLLLVTWIAFYQEYTGKIAMGRAFWVISSRFMCIKSLNIKWTVKWEIKRGIRVGFIMLSHFNILRTIAENYLFSIALHFQP